MKYLLLFSVFIFLFVGCGNSSGTFLNSDLASIAEEIPYILTAGQDANHAGITKYDINGNLLATITDFRTETATPRGLAILDQFNFLVAVDTSDAIYNINAFGEKTVFHGSALFSGAIYNLRIAPSGKIYAIESNRIEVFDSSGNRLASDYITTTTGACVLSAPRGLLINSSGNLVVTDQADRIMTYDLSTTPASCLSSNALGSNLNPYGLIEHSDGYLYFVTQQDDSIYRADLDGSNIVQLWTTNISILRDPTAIAELPNGNLLIASSTTDTIEEFTTSGVRVSTLPFIRNAHSLNVSDIIIVSEE